MGRAENADQSGSPRPPRRPLARWRKVSLAVALAIMVAGLGLWAYAALSADEAPATRSGAAAPSSFSPTSGGEPAEAEPSPVAQWSPAIFRLGFSFVAAFCMAYALRTFARIAAVVIGSALLLLVGLHYSGLVEVRWDAMEERYNGLSGWLGAQTKSFAALVTGYLPSAAAAAAGFVAGFTRR